MAARDCVLLEMNVRKADLEEIFIELTEKGEEETV